jgi:hypothetical protein
MTVTKGKVGSPLPQGKTFNVLKNNALAAGEDTHKFGVDADGILIWVEVFSVTGTVDVVVDTIGETDSNYKNVITFPTISSPTAEPLERTAVNILSTIRVTVNYTGSCDYAIRARGISRGGAGADDAPLTVEVDFDPLLVANPQIQNLTLTTAGAEQAVALPLGTKRFKFQAENDALLQYTYVANQSGTAYITVWPGNSEEETDIDEEAVLTIYVQSNKNNTPFQLLVWL